MALTIQDFKDILTVGIQLTVEKDDNKLLNTIVEKGMQITNCDAGTLYLYEDNVLKFRIMRTISQNVYRGLDGEHNNFQLSQVSQANLQYRLYTVCLPHRR